MSSIANLIVDLSWPPGPFSLPEIQLLHNAKTVLSTLSGGKTSFSGTLKSPGRAVSGIDNMCRSVLALRHVLSGTSASR